MGIPAESAYHDGFVDGQEDILDGILDIVDEYGSYEDAAVEISDFVARKKREIESL